MTLVKVCGVTTVEDAVLAADLGADLLGLNFHPPSPRFVGVEQAAAISAAVEGRVRKVGVFVNRSADEIADIASRVPLDLVQFHGDEGPEQVEPWGERAIKAFRVGETFDPQWLAEYPRVWGFLFDCRSERVFGGSGEAWNYDTIAGLSSGSKPMLVAGGLRPENVRRALARSRADGVDVCSGIEASRGRKDEEKMRRFFQEVNDGSR